MPLHLPTRRQFVTQFGAAVALVHLDASAKDVDHGLIAILNDTHIGERHPENSPVPTRLRQAINHITNLPKAPEAVVINGDLALNQGTTGDYLHFGKLMAPLRAAGIQVHLTMGNHDDRDIFLEALNAGTSQAPLVSARHVAVVHTTKANLILLDSLKAPNIAQGLLGDVQRSWLSKTLDEHADKPALVFAHHNPRLGGDPKHFPGGLEDSHELWKLLVARKHVKAYIHGHIHHRDFFEHEGIHILNTPAVGYVANKQLSTTGWTMLRVTEDGAEVTTHTHQADHAWNGAKVPLKWRA